MFGNALDNAIEHEKKEKAENRYIFLKILQKGKMVSIRIENYCETFPKLSEAGLPVRSSKKDSELHGYGTKACSILQKNMEQISGSFRRKICLW